MKFGILSGLVAALFALFISTADARPRHHHYHGARDRSHAHITRHYDARPSDCYGIAWCGCWLRHQFGIADTHLNLAAAWRRYPKVDAASANVVVWPGGHHVGKVLGVDGKGRFQVISGNSGGSGINTRWYDIRKGFSFHRV